MRSNLRTVRTKKGVKKYTYLGCPLTRNRSAWCYRLCEPDREGHGKCGRIAPHSLKSAIQLAIAKHNKKLAEIHCAKLERMFMSAACNRYDDPGIKVSSGAAEIVVSVKKKFRQSSGAVHSSILFKALADSAFYAVNSLVNDVLVSTVGFNIFLTRSIERGELIAKGRFTIMAGDHFLADAVLTDSEGKEIGRASGTFVKGSITLSPRIGYE